MEVNTQELVQTLFHTKILNYILEDTTTLWNFSELLMNNMTFTIGTALFFRVYLQEVWVLSSTQII